MTAYDPHDRFDSHPDDATAPGPDALLAMLRLQNDVELAQGEQARSIDARLNADPALRAQAESLAQLDSMLRGMVSRGAGEDVTRAASDRALQASLRLVREQALLRRQHQAAQHHRVLSGMPRWAWGVAAAAAVAIGLVIWTVNTDPSAQIANNTGTTTDVMPMRPPFGQIDAVTTADADNSDDIQQQINALDYISQMGDVN